MSNQERQVGRRGIRRSSNVRRWRSSSTREREAAESSEREVAAADLVTLMLQIFDASDGNYGRPTDAPRTAPRRRDRERHADALTDATAWYVGRCRRRRCQTTFPGPDGYEIPATYFTLRSEAQQTATA